ncbi:cytochrome c/c1 heme-lyase [Aspergillus egyptiacus]|nr:cytochrome c/c1 heme-lyase [Aspergillus egyptiacus]
MGAGQSTPTPSTADAPPAATCPVDHKAREAWLQQHKGASGAPHPIPSDEPKSVSKQQRPLSTDREVSSIPRALNSDLKQPPSECPVVPSSPYSTSPTASHGTPSNAESETGHDKSTGNWVYPSERQFFEALMRKGNTPGSVSSASELATAVASIIPIHNAVNERAWQQILEWESRAPSSDPGSKKCGGPKLYSFRGLGSEPEFMSPRARFNSLMGYQSPFDRHDWVVERCGGERVEYVIDFYQGKSTGGGKGTGLAANAGPGKLSFYLDVRPKLNTVEGCMMRMKRFAGL